MQLPPSFFDFNFKFRSVARQHQLRPKDRATRARLPVPTMVKGIHAAWGPGSTSFGTLGDLYDHRCSEHRTSQETRTLTEDSTRVGDRAEEARRIIDSTVERTDTLTATAVAHSHRRHRDHSTMDQRVHPRMQQKWKGVHLLAVVTESGDLSKYITEGLSQISPPKQHVVA
jgi:hypothetical protein